MMFGSEDFDANTITLEVIDLYYNTSTICKRKLDSFDAVDYQISTSISGHLNTLPYIQTEKQAFLFLNNGSVQVQRKTAGADSILDAFSHVSATQLNHSSIFVMNTYNTKLITMNVPNNVSYANGPKVKHVPRFGHCVVSLNETTLMVVGGLNRAVDTFGFWDLQSGLWYGFDPREPGPVIEKPKCCKFYNALHSSSEEVVLSLGLDRHAHVYIPSQNRWEKCYCEFPGYIEKVNLIPAPQNDGVLAFSWERE